MFWLIPSKPPTPSEYAVLLYAFSILAILAGLVGLVVSFNSPLEKHAAALALERYSFWALGTGMVFGFGVWLVRRLID